MAASDRKVLVTGANGHLGRLVVDGLLRRIPPDRVIATVRDSEAGAPLSAVGVEVRRADYDDPSSLDAAFAGVDKLLLISSSELGKRVSQHRNVIEAARRAGVGLIAYTSILRADTSPLGLATERLATERLLGESGLPFALLRNGWYTENYTAAASTAVANGTVLGSAGDGRVASAARADYAEAAAAVLTSEDEQAGKIYELAGDGSYTLAELASEISRQSGSSVAYRQLPEAAYRSALEGSGLPTPLAGLLADSDVGASKGGLFDDGRQLSALIGRPTTPLSQSVRAALAA